MPEPSMVRASRKCAKCDRGDCVEKPARILDLKTTLVVCGIQERHNKIILKGFFVRRKTRLLAACPLLPLWKPTEEFLRQLLRRDFGALNRLEVIPKDRK